MKLQKLLQSQGIGSRKEVVALIKSGRVTICGAPLRDPNASVDAAAGFALDGEDYSYHEHLFIALHKPVGYECSHNPSHHASVYSLLPSYAINRKVEAVGRLDQDTTGLLLFTDDGKALHRLSSPKKQCPKQYRVGCKHALSPLDCEQLLTGVTLHGDGEVRALDVQQVTDTELLLTIGEGKYHQVKRMIAAVKNRVVTLHREAVGGLSLGALCLAEGELKTLSSREIAQLERSE